MLGRRVGASGRTSAFVGGRSASAADLRALGARLIAFYGQHEHRKLTLAAAQAESSTASAGPSSSRCATRYRAAHAEVGSLDARARAIRERDGARERDLDLLRYELGEIEAAAPDPSEEAELAGRARAPPPRRGPARGRGGRAARDRRRRRGRRGVGGRAARRGRGRARRGRRRRRAPRRARRAGRRARDRGLRPRRASCAPTSRASRRTRRASQEVEERLEALDRLRRKHGGTIEAVLEHAERCRDRDRAARGRRGAKRGARRALARGDRRARAARRELSEERVRLAPKLEKRGRRRARRAGDGRRAARGRARTVAPAVDGGEGYAASGRESVELHARDEPRDARRHRFATRPRAASSRG